MGLLSFDRFNVPQQKHRPSGCCKTIARMVPAMEGQCCCLLCRVTTPQIAYATDAHRPASSCSKQSKLSVSATEAVAFPWA